jgi:hypothetical protein
MPPSFGSTAAAKLKTKKKLHMSVTVVSSGLGSFFGKRREPPTPATGHDKCQSIFHPLIPLAGLFENDTPFHKLQVGKHVSSTIQSKICTSFSNS